MHEFAPPALQHPQLTGEPFLLQVQRGELEAYGVRVNTTLGPIYLRLFRYLDAQGGEAWCCHQNNKSRYSITAHDALLAQDALNGCLGKLPF